MNANGNNPTRLTTNTVVDFTPTWSPDGTRIAFTTLNSANFDQLFTMAVDGSNPRRLTKGGNSTFPDWQPKP
jgi:Tol biopolymer transport system component